MRSRLRNANAAVICPAACAHVGRACKGDVEVRRFCTLCDAVEEVVCASDVVRFWRPLLHGRVVVGVEWVEEVDIRRRRNEDVGLPCPRTRDRS